VYVSLDLYNHEYLLIKVQCIKDIATIAAPDGTTSTTTKSSTAGEGTIVNLNVPSATDGVVVDASSREATATSAKSTKEQNPYKKQSAVAPAGATTKSGGTSTAVLSAVADVSISDNILNNATTPSANFTKLKTHTRSKQLSFCTS
jgi:hypothetical protein